MKFARKLWKLLVALKDAMALLFLLMFFGLLYAALSARPSAGNVEDGALLLDLNGSIVEERSAVDAWSLLSSGSGPTREFQARDVERALRLAATDPRIKVVVLDLSRFLGGRFVHLHDIGRAMDQVRKSGKPVLAFANAYADDGTQLAAHASEVWVDPMGGAFVSGPGGTMLFYKGLFDRFKVNAHVYRVGTYKSYVEPYIRSNFSPEAKSDMQRIYGALWGAYRADIAAARPRARLDQLAGDPAAFYAANGNDMARASKAAGLVDRIGDRTEFEARVTQLAGVDTSGADKGKADRVPYAHTRLSTWLAANPEQKGGVGIGVVTIAGDIVDGDAGPGTAGGDRIARLLDDHLGDGLKALVVRIDSPGGSVMASERIRRALTRWREHKIPVVISMGNYAASGGYWVSTPGQHVFAEPGTITGSIGVFAILTSFEKTLADYGVTSDGVQTTPLSGQPDLFGGFNPQVDKVLQGSIDSTYAKFLGVVGKARGKTPQQVDAIAQGRVWPGAQAKGVGLVDEMGDLDAAIAYAARAGGVGNGAWHAEYLKTKQDKLDALLGGMFADSDGDTPAASDFASMIALRQQMQARQVVARLQELGGTRGMQAYCLECGARATTPEPGTGDASLMRLLMRVAGWK